MINQDDTRGLGCVGPCYVVATEAVENESSSSQKPLGLELL